MQARLFTSNFRKCDNMKKNVFRLVIFFCGLFVICSASILISSKSDILNTFFGRITNSGEYDREEVNGGPFEIIPFIERVQQDSTHTKLILGDSVTRKVFNGLQNSNEDYLVLGTNQAITMTGQYLLAEEFIKNHENVSDIYIIFIPGSFATGFTYTYGYQYAVMPFVETDIFSNLDADTIQLAEETYGSFLLQKNVVEMVDYSQMNRKIVLNLLYEFGEMPEGEYEYIADPAVRCIKRLQETCEKKNINLHFLPGPIPDREDIRQMVEIQKEEFEKVGLADLMESYYDALIYYPEADFPDGTHPGGEYDTQENLNRMIEALQSKSGKLEDLVLDFDKQIEE